MSGFSGGPREQQAKGHDGIAAGFQVWLGFNTQSTLIAPAREGGITSVVAAPSGGLVVGQAAIVDLSGALALNDVLVKAPATMVAQIEDDDERESRRCRRSNRRAARPDRGHEGVHAPQV